VFIEAKDDGSGGDNWTTGAIREGKNITFHELVYPKLTWGLPTLSFNH